jgi:hypothetical protein
MQNDVADDVGQMLMWHDLMWIPSMLRELV